MPKAAPAQRKSSARTGVVAARRLTLADKGQPRSEPGKVLVSAEQLGRRPRRPTAETLLAATQAVDPRHGLAEVLQQTTTELARALGAQIGGMWRYDGRGRALRPFAADTDARDRLEDTAVSSSVALARILTTVVRRGGRAVYFADSARDPLFDDPAVKLLPHRSVLIQPLHVRGQLAGIFVFIWTGVRHRLQRFDLPLVEAVTRQAGIAIENAELFAEVRALNVDLERRVRQRTLRLERAYGELQRSREQLRAVSIHMERVRESERARIAREIHDELGQALTGLKMDLVRVVRPNGHGPVDVTQLPGLVDRMIGTVRRIASELRPPLLDDLGLIAALEWQAREFEGRTGVRCVFRSRGNPVPIDADRSTALFRIFQEILTNVARHAEATMLQVTLEIAPSSVRLDVRDNGKGLGGEAGAVAPRLGLLGMQERAAAFGGRVVVSPSAPRGTRVRARIPLPAGRRPMDADAHHRL